MNRCIGWVIGLSALGLSGCANQAFDCPHKEGVRCVRLSEIDRQINAEKMTSTPLSQQKKSFKKLDYKAAPDSPLRTTEEVLSVWIAPYQAKDGTYHEQNIIHFVAKPAAWVNVDTEITPHDDE